MPGIAMIEPLRTAGAGNGVAAMIEHGKTVAMFKRSRPALVERGRRRDEELGLRLGQRLPSGNTRHVGLRLAQGHGVSYATICSSASTPRWRRSRAASVRAPGRP